mgnify:CR=1 FL=1
MKKLSYKEEKFLLKKSRKGKSKRIKKFKNSRAHINPYKNNFIPNNQNKKREYNLYPPSDFSIKTNPKGVISFIYEMKSLSRGKAFISEIKLNLDDIENIDIGAICMTLSVIEEYSMQGILFSGSAPNNKECLEIFIDSGFLSHMTNIYSSKKTILESENVILKRGRDKINGQKSGEIIKKCMGKITGREQHFKPIYNILGEISLNSFEHAYKKSREKHWFFSIYYDKKENKIIFVFADNGIGIINTLNRKISRKVIEKLQLKDNIDILNNGFERKYGSSFDDQPNRNKGLPSIKDKQNKQFINNLTIITNNVYINFDTDKKIILKKNYSGTLYYWELDNNCISLYNERNKAI